MLGNKGTTMEGRMARSVLRGFPLAVGVTAGLICMEKAYHAMYPPPDHGGHH